MLIEVARRVVAGLVLEQVPGRGRTRGIGELQGVRVDDRPRPLTWDRRGRDGRDIHRSYRRERPAPSSTATSCSDRSRLAAVSAMTCAPGLVPPLPMPKPGSPAAARSSAVSTIAGWSATTGTSRVVWMRSVPRSSASGSQVARGDPIAIRRHATDRPVHEAELVAGRRVQHHEAAVPRARRCQRSRAPDGRRPGSRRRSRRGPARTPSAWSRRGRRWRPPAARPAARPVGPPPA